MGTKRAFDEELQEFNKHPKPLKSGDKPSSSAENELPLDSFQVYGIEDARKDHTGNDQESETNATVPDMGFEISAQLPLVTDISTDEGAAGPWHVPYPSVFSEYYGYKPPRRQIFDDGDRKAIPVGPNHQADVPEFDLEVAMNYNNNFDNGEMEKFLGVCVIPMPHSNSDDVVKDDEASDCECWDCGSIRCVQQHVKEARLKLRKSLGDEQFVSLGMIDIGEEVAQRWSQDEEQIFHDVVYRTAASNCKISWTQISILFQSKTVKEVVSYYFNVFILQRRAVQNRLTWLEIDSDDDGWRDKASTSYGDDDCSCEDGVDRDSHDIEGEGEGECEGQGDFVIGDSEKLTICLKDLNSSEKVNS